MPLSSPAQRERMHTRRIEIDGYLREDGLWDIEAHLTDEKSYEFDNEWRGRVEPGAKVHDMWIRLTVDDARVIHGVEVTTDVGPYRICPEVAPNFQVLKGIKIGPGWFSRVKELLGGTRGCTHLVELLGPLATVVYQTQTSQLLERKRAKAAVAGNPSGEAGAAQAAASQARRRPWWLNTCHAYASDSEVVKRFHPDFYTGT
ncbi:MAG: DUF2889 domain-containing protein [Alphaproteobacteria bacterium]|nr:DUF2889 domain-containing protein [Alphaproteobacteria bacterium]